MNYKCHAEQPHDGAENTNSKNVTNEAYVIEDDCETGSLSTLQRHWTPRTTASEKIKKTREEMVQRFEKNHCSKVNAYEVGDNVSVRVPKKDCSNTHASRMPCVVISVSGDKERYYQLLTQHGVLHNKYRSGDLEFFRGNFNMDLKNSDKFVSLREANRLQNVTESMWL
ncbi:uncharacterized protein LOC130641806 [Hydractinia symbiolongicarpus]|uniref:uncharacterized protein LOC130641806 n=1 Tax=Hydractinia symbiolongicarpus TaxID=13093 RepID=UPI00254BA412|nr:uncharacterized protein LOC130641806 [Hydractinia symbiolongicarpus]